MRIMKYILNELSLIQKLLKPIAATLSSENATIEDVQLKKKEGKGFTVEVFHRGGLQWGVGDLVEFELQNPEIRLAVKGFVSSMGFDSDPTRGPNLKASVWKFHDEAVTDNKMYFCRTIIPLQEKYSSWNIVAQESFASDKFSGRMGLIKLSIHDTEFHVFDIEFEEKFYLFIDCLAPKTRTEFHAISWSALVGLSYLLGYLPQDEGYTFYYSDADLNEFVSYSYEELRNSIKTSYSPTNANSHAWIGDYEEASKYYGNVSEVTTSQLSKLCSLVHESDEIKAILLLVLESMKGSLLSMPAGLSVALEGLSEYFYEQNTEVFNPITDPALSKQIRNELKATLAKYKGHKGVQGYPVLEAKINELNRPSNADKLKAPFTVLDITLTPQEEEAIMYRNDFLHGNINLKPGKKSAKKTYEMDSYEIALRIYTLINAIILKKIGYSGYLLNYAKIQERGMGKHFAEPYYRTL